MKKLINIVVLLSVLINYQIAFAQIDKLELIDFGLLTSKTIEVIDLNSTASGKYVLADELKIYEKTSNVPAKMGITFGVEFFVHGSPSGERAQLVYNVIHPEFKGEKFSTALVNTTIGENNIYFYRFDEEFEMVEGTWILQFSLDGKLLLEKEFEVYGPL